MKKIVLSIVFLFSIYATFGQEIEINGAYASSSSKKFLNNFECGIGYNQYIKSKSRIGISLLLYFSTTQYDDIYNSTVDGTSQYIEQIDPNNKRLAVHVNYAFNLINNPKSSLFLGPEIGLNYFWIIEQYDRIPNGNITGGHFSSDYSKNNKISIGFLFEYELKEVINKNISTYLSIHPEITGFEKFGTKGSHNPMFIGWLNFNLGIRYYFLKK